MKAREADERGKFLVTLDAWLFQETGRRARCLFTDSYMYPDIRAKDPRSVWVDERAKIGDGTYFWPDVYVVGECEIGKNSVIGPLAHIDDSIIGEEAEIGFTAQIKRSHIGNFFKAKHHCYVGDAIVGDNVNIGAGFITANFDGVEKHQTIIEDGAYLGVNVNLVAPIRIGKEAMVAAGSTLKANWDVKPYTLVIARAQPHKSQSKYQRHTSRGYEMIEIPKARLEQLIIHCRWKKEELYDFFTTPNQCIEGRLPIDLLLLKNGKKLFDQFLLQALSGCRPAH